MVRDEIIALFREGLPCSEIARRVGRERRNVNIAIYKHYKVDTIREAREKAYREEKL